MAKVLALKRVAFYDPERDGVTHSILAKFKACRQMARDALEGWQGKAPSFPLTYGSLTHYVLNQAYDNVLIHQDRGIPTEKQVIRWLEDARRIWMHEHPVHSAKADEIFEEAIMKNAAVMPTYFKYWKSDFTKRVWMDVENEFRIPFEVVMPDGLTIRTFIRGKMDGAFLVPTSKRGRAPRLMESKTRTQIDETALVDTMPLNQQTGIYLIGLEAMTGKIPAEVELNIIRKPALRQGKNESPALFESRIRQDVQARPDWYFVRMKMTVLEKDVIRIKEDIHALIKDFLLWWYGFGPHYRNDGSCYLYHRPCDMLQKCTYGSTSDLFKRKTVFSELEDE